jgi:hypothetical protein
MFIRKKTVAGKTYHYLVKSVRVDGKVKQQVLAYLGTHDTVESAYRAASGAQRRKLEKFRGKGNK